MDWYIKALKNYVNFTGRARRKEFWLFFLFNILIMLSFSFIATTIKETDKFMQGLFVFYGLGIIIPSISAIVRRLHDIGKSGWWIFIILIPIIGKIWLIVLLATDSQLSENKWGKNPKEANNKL